MYILVEVWKIYPCIDRLSGGLEFSGGENNDAALLQLLILI